MVSSRNGKRGTLLDRTSNFSLYCIFLMRHLVMPGVFFVA
nr:MAG TPA: hypothetical protein [Caudoviricetes sp.]